MSISIYCTVILDFCSYSLLSRQVLDFVFVASDCLYLLLSYPWIQSLIVCRPIALRSGLVLPLIPSEKLFFSQYFYQEKYEIIDHGQAGGHQDKLSS